MDQTSVTHAEASGAYGEKLAEVFGVPSAPVVVNRSLRAGRLAATEVRDDAPELALSGAIPLEDAWLATLHLTTITGHTAWEEGGQYPSETLRKGDLLLRDLKRNPTVLVNQPHHEIHFYVPRSALDAIADDCEARQIDGLHYAPGRPVADEVMVNLGNAMLGAFAAGEEANVLFLDHLLSAIALHLAVSAGGLEPRSRSVRGGLTRSQERRAKEVLSANLSGTIEIAAIARECDLSTGYFSRAFRASTGMAPHQWLLRRRIDVAKQLLSGTARPLAEIALDSGFIDQSHLTRVFSRQLGISPGRWRAANGSSADRSKP